MCVCKGNDLKGLMMVYQVNEDGGYDLCCQRCARRMAKEGSLEAFELTRRGARRLLTEEVISNPHRPSSEHEFQQRLAGLRGDDPRPEAPTVLSEVMSERERLQRARAGLGPVDEELSLGQTEAAIRGAIALKFSLSFVLDIFTDPSRVIIDLGGKSFEVPFEIDDLMDVTLQQPRQVQKQYVPVS